MRPVARRWGVPAGTGGSAGQHRRPTRSRPITHDMHFNDIEPDWTSDPDNYDTYDRE